MTVLIPASSLRPGNVYHHAATRPNDTWNPVLSVETLDSGHIQARCQMTTWLGNPFEWSFLFRDDEMIEIEEG